MLGFTGKGGGGRGSIDPRTQGATRNPDKGKGKDKERPALVGGQGNCPTCKGTHPECSICPNVIAAKDSNYEQAKAIAEKKACWYHHCFKIGTDKCTGIGHITGHHVEALSKEGKQQYEKAKAEHAKKSPERKNDKKERAKEERHVSTPLEKPKVRKRR